MRYLLSLLVVLSTVVYADTMDEISILRKLDKTYAITVVGDSVIQVPKQPNIVRALIQVWKNDGPKQNMYVAVSGCQYFSARGGYVMEFTDDTYKELKTAGIRRWTTVDDIDHYLNVIAIEICTYKDMQVYLSKRR